MGKHPYHPRPSDDHLGPQVNLQLLRRRLYELRIPQTAFADVADIAHPLISQVLLGRRPATLRLRYRIARAIHQTGLDYDGQLISGHDGFIDYTPEIHVEGNVRIDLTPLPPILTLMSRRDLRAAR